MSQEMQVLKKFAECLWEGTRDDGSTYYFMADGTPEEFKEVVRDAHGEMMPDDYKYRFIAEAANKMLEMDEDELEIPQMEADIYTGDLIAWLSSHLDRTYYVNEAVQQGLVDIKEFDLIQAMMAGQELEMSEVAGVVYSRLVENVEDYAHLAEVEILKESVSRDGLREREDPNGDLGL